MSEQFTNLHTETQRGYERSLKRLAAVFGDLRPSDWQPAWGQHYVDQMSSRPAAANADLGVLSVIFARATRSGLIDANHVREVQRHARRPRRRYVTDAEIAAFLAVASPRLCAYVDLKLSIGVRIGQMVALRWSDWTGSELVVKAVVDDDQCGRQEVGGGGRPRSALGRRLPGRGDAPQVHARFGAGPGGGQRAQRERRAVLGGVRTLMPMHVDLGSKAVPMRVVRVDRLAGRKHGVRLQLAEGKANVLTAVNNRELALTVHGRLIEVAGVVGEGVAYEVFFDPDRMAEALRTALLCGVWKPI